MVDFSDALSYLKAGDCLSRHIWGDNPTIYIKARELDSGDWLAEIVSLRSDGEERIPWNPGMGDVFANDWYVIGPIPPKPTEG